MKVTIIGGGGRVGSTAAFSIMINNLASEVVLIDISEDRAKGEALDLAHSVSGMKIDAEVYGGSDYSLTEDSDIIIVTAGVTRKPSMNRLELAETNIGIVRDVTKRALDYSKNPFVFIVSNPVDVLTYNTLKLSNLESSRVFGLGTLLDTMRLKSLLKLRFDTEYSEEVMIIGEHGDSMTPVFSHLGADVLMSKLWNVFEEVRVSAGKVIEAKGGTWFAPATAISDVVRGLQNEESTIMPISVYLENHEICIGYPSEVSSSGVRPVNYNLSRGEEELFLKSVDRIRSAINKNLE